MKSILAKQAPQSSPWLPMRVRQEMQTGGRRNRQAAEHRAQCRRPSAGGAAGASRPSSASPVGMATMIGPDGPGYKACEHERRAPPVRPQIAAGAPRALRA